MTPGTPATSTRSENADQHGERQPAMAARAMLVAWAATTAARPMMKPSERSMPPEMMTKVWPSASSSGATAKIAIDCTLNGLRKKVAPKASRAQTSKTDEQAGEEQPGAQRRRCAAIQVLAGSAWSACGATCVSAWRWGC